MSGAGEKSGEGENSSLENSRQVKMSGECKVKYGDTGKLQFRRPTSDVVVLNALGTFVLALICASVSVCTGRKEYGKL